MASSTLVLPVPFGPVMTVVPSVSGVKAAAPKIRKSTSSSAAQAHRDKMIPAQETRTGISR